MTAYQPKVGDLCMFKYGDIVIKEPGGMRITTGPVLVQIVQLPRLFAGEISIRYIETVGDSYLDSIDYPLAKAHTFLTLATPEQIAAGVAKGLQVIEQRREALNQQEAALRALLPTA
ncbi:MAG: hypothetical protein EBQ80_03435 [Proteobacteria bacterium]|nr:hypothetical protein [Pseudomonadota bacterium]